MLLRRQELERRVGRRRRSRRRYVHKRRGSRRKSRQSRHRRGGSGSVRGDDVSDRGIAVENRLRWGYRIYDGFRLDIDIARRIPRWRSIVEITDGR